MIKGQYVRIKADAETKYAGKVGQIKTDKPQRSKPESVRYRFTVKMADNNVVRFREDELEETDA